MATKVAFPRQFREVKLGNATREKGQMSESVITLRSSLTLMFFSKRVSFDLR